MWQNSRQLRCHREQGTANRGVETRVVARVYSGAVWLIGAMPPSLSLFCSSLIRVLEIGDSVLVFPTHPLQVSIAQLEGAFRRLGVGYAGLQPAAAVACWLSTLSVVASMALPDPVRPAAAAAAATCNFSASGKPYRVSVRCH